MTHASLFSGIGGPEVAAAMLGWENLFHCEINPFGRKVLEYWFPDSVSYEDITKTSFKEWRGKVDVLTGGFPCQPFSYAGKRGGAEDARYLWPEMLRAIDEIRPAWVIGENVAGLSTMVEGWLPTEVGRGASLFEEGADLHDWVVEQAFTIERIAGELEGLGYSVQPVLIPAAACGAPHRRDRIFILAFNADADRRDDVRSAGEKRLQERHEIRESGISDQIRPARPGVIADAKHDGLQYGLERGGKGGLLEEESAGGKSRLSNEIQFAPAKGARDASSDPASRGGGALSEHLHPGLPDGDVALCDGRERDAADAHGSGREKSLQPRREAHRPEDGAGLDDRTLGPRGDGKPADAIGERLEGKDQPRPDQGVERLRLRRDLAGRDWEGLRPGERWASFPTVSPIHRGNDGLPFNVDNLTISFTSWRTESLKAYGNAIVPQVMYRIFEAIEKVSK